MSHLLYLMFRCDGDVMESLDFGEFLRDLNTPPVYSTLFALHILTRMGAWLLDRIKWPWCPIAHSCYFSKDLANLSTHGLDLPFFAISAAPICGFIEKFRVGCTHWILPRSILARFWKCRSAAVSVWPVCMRTKVDRAVVKRIATALGCV